MGPVAAQMKMTMTAPMNPAVEPAQWVTVVANRDGKLARLRARRSVSFSLSNDSKRPRRGGSGGILMAVSHLSDRSCHHRYSDAGNSRDDAGRFRAIDVAGQAHLHAFRIEQRDRIASQQDRRYEYIGIPRNVLQHELRRRRAR